VPNAPTLTIASISPPALNTRFIVTGGVFNDAPVALDYSTDGGASWLAAPGPVITQNAYSFTAPGLAAGTYTLRVRDHGNPAILAVSNGFTIAAPTISLAVPPASLPLNVPVALSGTVSPANNAVQVGLSASATAAPANWVSAAVSDGDWSVSLTPATAGIFYIWAQQNAEPSVQAISGPVGVVAAAISVSAPATGTAGTALSIAGTVSPASDSVNVQLSTQNVAVPTGGWSAATNASGSFTASLTPASGGMYYVWAQDAETGLGAVSAAITVAAAPSLTFSINNPGGSYVHGVSTIGLNGSVTPPQNVATQVALSTSGTILPSTGWEAATIYYNNELWAVYYATPATPGNYYVWVQTSAGASTVVSSFTIPVS